MRRAVIIGGGVAGLCAALSLAERRVPSVIIEREERLGGLCTELGCKGVARCVRCDSCLAEDKLALVASSPLIERQRGAEVTSVSGGPGHFRISIRTSSGARSLQAGAIICATGAEPFDASLDKRLGLGEVGGVITTLDLERTLREKGRPSLSPDGKALKNVAFVLCVGSRDERLKSGYCSKACCKTSFKLAQALKVLGPPIAITFLFMDWRLYDPKENVRLWATGQEDVRLVRSRPAEVVQGEDGRPEVRFALEGDASIEAHPFDLVVLAVGMRPAKGSNELAGRLRIELDDFGFMRSLPGEPCLSTRPGILLAGACRGPKDIAESAKDGALAASMAMSILEGDG